MNKEPSENKSQSTSNAVAYRYVGNGDFLQGVPARDLTEEDVDALSKDEKKALEASGLYSKKGGK